MCPLLIFSLFTNAMKPLIPVTSTVEPLGIADDIFKKSISKDNIEDGTRDTRIYDILCGLRHFVLEIIVA